MKKAQKQFGYESDIQKTRQIFTFNNRKEIKKVTIPIFCNIVENYNNIKDKWYICYP